MRAECQLSIWNGDKLLLKFWPGGCCFTKTADGYRFGAGALGGGASGDITPEQMAQKLWQCYGGTKPHELLLKLGWLDVAAAYEAEGIRRVGP